MSSSTSSSSSSRIISSRSSTPTSSSSSTSTSSTSTSSSSSTASRSISSFSETLTLTSEGSTSTSSPRSSSNVITSSDNKSLSDLFISFISFLKSWILSCAFFITLSKTLSLSVDSSIWLNFWHDFSETATKATYFFKSDSFSSLGLVPLIFDITSSRASTYSL